MAFIALFDGLLGLNIGGKLILDLLRQPDRVKIQLGEFLTISPLPAALILLGVFTLPLLAAAIWAARRVTVSPAPS